MSWVTSYTHAPGKTTSKSSPMVQRGTSGGAHGAGVHVCGRVPVLGYHKPRMHGGGQRCSTMECNTMLPEYAPLQNDASIVMGIPMISTPLAVCAEHAHSACDWHDGPTCRLYTSNRTSNRTSNHSWPRIAQDVRCLACLMTHCCCGQLPRTTMCAIYCARPCVMRCTQQQTIITLQCPVHP